VMFLSWAFPFSSTGTPGLSLPAPSTPLPPESPKIGTEYYVVFARFLTVSFPVHADWSRNPNFSLPSLLPRRCVANPMTATVPYK